MSFIKIKYYLLTFSFVFLCLLLSGQNDGVFVEAKFGNDSINIGSQTSVGLSIATPETWLWQWPEFTGKITDKVEIVSQTGIDTIRQRRSNLVLLKKNLTITSFDSGFHAIPPFIFQYKTPDDTVWTSYETQAFLLHVSGVDVDLSLPIRDIKGPERAPITFFEILTWLILALLIAGGIFGYRYYLKKKRAKAPLLPKPIRPKVPPHTKALDALEQLRNKKLWQSGRIKEYHSEITDILRHYLEERYGIMAIEMTTTEIIEMVNIRQVPSQAKEKLFVIFERADMVKFAKSIPLAGEHEESFVLAVDFVRATMPLAFEQTQAGNINTAQENENLEKSK